MAINKLPQSRDCSSMIRLLNKLSQSLNKLSMTKLFWNVVV